VSLVETPLRRSTLKRLFFNTPIRALAFGAKNYYRLSALQSRRCFEPCSVTVVWTSVAADGRVWGPALEAPPVLVLGGGLSGRLLPFAGRRRLPRRSR
jgi:hypothetical protein